VQTRSLLRQTIRFPATDTLRAASAQARLRYMLDHPTSLDEQTAVLGGLLLAARLDFVLGAGSSRQTRAGLTGMLETLRPDLVALVAGVESAVAQLTLTAHR
jgi:hypothetical protein